MQYEIIQGNSPDDLKFKVEDKIRSEWKPIGGISVTARNPGYSNPNNVPPDQLYFYQAMVLETN